MTDNRLLSQLLNELLDSDATPEDVCRSHPELLPEVRARWREACCFRSQLNTLFPAPEPGINSLAFSREDTVLPQIPFYEVRRVLGHGGVGVVYEARHVRLNRTVALKMLLAGPYALPEERERFQREAAAVAGLHHPNIVQVYDSGEFDKRPYFTMELVEGGTLSEKLAGTPMPARDAAALVATLADAIRAAHAAGIIHRDLKPANILLAPNSNVESRNRKQIPSPKETNPKPEQAGREISDFEFRISDFEPKVSDFGLARRMEGEAGLTRTGAVMGTPSYMAPEQARGDKNAVGAAVDVYALGAILYECLTGRPPFRAETASATMQQVMTDDPVPPARLNRGVLSDLETICLKCLHKSPNRRYASAQELAADLHRFLEGKPILARQAGAAERAVKWARRRPASAALAATALALVGLALGGTLWLERQQAQRRAETARHEGRTSQAVEARLEQAAALEKQGRWPEARTALDVAPLMFESPAQASLREGLRQARADLDMVAALEEIRLRLSEGGRASGTAPPMAGQLYAEAFRHYGIDLTTLEPEEAAAQIRASAIRETLLAFLHDWLFRLPVENQGRLQGVLNQADDDSWRHSFRQALQEKDAKKLSDLTHAPGASAQPPGVIAGLAAAMLENSYKYEAQEFLCQAQQRYPGDFWINYFLGCFWWEDYPQEAVGYFRVAV
ncbi:MAG TPA: serine/threonine-protein kinase, partial [Gemmataceae bacterium]|nr:serine/threonine-protein kinase [Gemmataceae bacterium]